VKRFLDELDAFSLPFFKRYFFRDFNYASGDDIVVTEDVDSIVVACHTMEPVKCEYACSIDTRPKILVSKNVKLTAYINKRRSFPRPFPRRFEAASDSVDPARTWYEIQLGQVDNRPLFMLFQIDDACTFVRESLLPAATTERQALLRECVNAFVRKFIARTARLCTPTPTRPEAAWDT